MPKFQLLNLGSVYILSFFVFALSLSCDIKSNTLKRQHAIIEKTDSPVIEKLKPHPYQAFVDEFIVQHKKELKKNGSIGSAMAIVSDGRVLFADGFGLRRARKKDSVDAHTVFRLGSLSKGFGGVLSAILVANKLISWNDTIAKYVPTFILSDSAQTQSITVENMLSHTTGLPRHSYTNLIEDGRTVDEILAQLSTVPINSKPGKYHEYTNITFPILEKMVEKKTGTSMLTFLQTKIFDAIGMKDASFSAKMHDETENKAYPHTRSRWGSFRKIRFNNKYYNAVFAGGINASAADMAQWLNLLMGHYEEVISKQDLAHVFAPFVKTRKRSYYHRWKGLKSSHYGMGWRVFDYQNRQIIHHGGAVNNFRTEILIDPDNKIGVCMLFNAPNSYASRAMDGFLKAFEKFKKQQLSSNKEQVASTAQ